jgi:hypothetical protein
VQRFVTAISSAGRVRSGAFREFGGLVSGLGIVSHHAANSRRRVAWQALR